MHLPHPWRRLRNSPHIKLNWFSGSGALAWCRHSTQEIFIRDDLTQAQRRSALIHELEHLAAGPAVKGYVHLDERQTCERAARWILPLPVVVKGLVWAGDDYELADELWVDVHTVRARLASLSAGESLYLEQRMDEAERRFPEHLATPRAVKRPDSRSRAAD